MPWSTVELGLFSLVAVSAAAAVAVAVHLRRPSRRLPWMLLAAGLVLGAAADLSFVVGLPEPAQVGLGAVADGLLLAALVALRPGWLRDRRALLAAVGVSVGAGLLAWALLVAAVSSLPAATAAVVWLRLLGDVLVVGTVAGLLAHGRGGRRPLRWMLAAATLGAATDLLMVLGVLSPRWFAVGSVVSLLGWAAAALHKAMAALTDPPVAADARLSRPGIVAAISTVLAPSLALGLQDALGMPLTVGPMVAGSVVLVALVAARVVLGVDQSAGAVDRERAQHELAHQAAHDSLTGVPNRAQALRLIRAALSRAQRSGATVGLLFVDLDGFKVVNDSLGHAVGDEVLRCTADRMQAAVRSGDVVGRLGGDEFVVMLEPVESDAAAVLAANRLIETISAPITLADGRQVGVGASVGVAMSMDASTDAESLLLEADMAVYRAKQSGKGRTEVFDQSLRRELRHRTHVETGVIAAIENDELLVHYQPIVNVLTTEVLGYEALVRWRRPDGAVVAPADFILIAEQSDLICELDSWVLRRATQQLAEWNRQRSGAVLFVSVNVSGRHIVRPRLCDDVDSALRASGVDPRQLVLEITETALIDDSLALANLETLRRAGVSISIDDFGSGYNSIARLEQLPVDIVKIDSRFLHRGGPSTNKLLRLIVQAAHAFDLPVVAEGVEHAHQLELLRSIECESAQGYFLGRPVDPSEIDIGAQRSVPAEPG